MQIHQRDAPRTATASTEEKNDACLASQVPTEQRLFLSQILIRSKGACGWISGNQKYRSWHDSNDSDLLWITAKAGCGKTTLAAHISEMLSTDTVPKPPQSIEPNEKLVVLSFFFHKSNEEAEGTATAALRTISNQLGRQVPHVLPVLAKRHNALSHREAFQ